MNVFGIEGDVETGKIDWRASARSHDNMRVTKMPTEAKQLLCGTLHVYGVDPCLLPATRGRKRHHYKEFNTKHTSNRWVSESTSNFMDIVAYCEELSAESIVRYGMKDYHLLDVLELSQILHAFKTIQHKFPTDDPTPLKLAMPEEYQGKNSIISYRKFWVSKPNFRYPINKIPMWFLEMRNEPFQIIKAV